jgi:ankyrin repeat protein
VPNTTAQEKMEIYTMKRKNVPLAAPAYLCSNVLGQQVVYHKRSIRELQEDRLTSATDVQSSAKVQSALHTAQNAIDDALFSAVQNKRIPQTIARHVAQGANITAVRDGLSPILLTIINKDAATLVFLLTHGANPNIRDTYGNTPLHHIALNITKKTVDMAEILIIAGAHVDAQNELGQTPLHFHGKGGALYQKLARLLIKHGARLDLVDIKGNQPLAKLSEKVRNELMRFALLNLFDR